MTKIAKDNDGEEHEVLMLLDAGWKDGHLIIGMCVTHRKVSMQFRSPMINFDYQAPVDPSDLPWEEQVEILANDCFIICEQLYEKGSIQSWMNYQQDLKDGNVEHKIPIQ